MPVAPPIRDRLRIAVWALLLGLAPVVVGACGDGSDTDRSNTDDTTADTDVRTNGNGGGRPATEEGLEDAARTYSGALLDRDYATAHEFLSSDCQGRLPRGEFDGFVDEIVEQVESEAEGDASQLEIGEVQVKNVTDSSGEVSAEVIDANGERVIEEPDFDGWVYQDGDWNLDGCYASGTDEDTLDTDPSP